MARHADANRKCAGGERVADESRLNIVNSLPQNFGDLDRLLDSMFGKCDDELVPSVAACHGVWRDVTGDQMTDGADGLGPSQMTELIVQGFEPVEVKHQQTEGTLIYSCLSDEISEVCFEGAQIVETGEVVSDGQQAHPVSIVGQLGGDKADGEEKKHLNDIALVVPEV